MTNGIKNLAHHKFYLKQKAVKFNSSNYHEAYKRCRNNLTKESKQLRHMANRKSKTTIVNELSVDHGKNVTQDKDIANEFNKFFTSTGPKLANNIADNGSSHVPL